ncbi:TPA: hypothetical protein HA344_09750 [Candidatus Bathyarchaeota archaeon]|nr:hypothetical protein [Candidatus Bathyarchaeota archaeon]
MAKKITQVDVISLNVERLAGRDAMEKVMEGREDLKPSIGMRPSPSGSRAPSTGWTPSSPRRRGTASWSPAGRTAARRTGAS